MKLYWLNYVCGIAWTINGVINLVYGKFLPLGIGMILLGLGYLLLGYTQQNKFNVA